jgi:hypothetical protein
MSLPGRPKGSLLPLGGKARCAKGAVVSPPGRPKGSCSRTVGVQRGFRGALLRAGGTDRLCKAGPSRTSPRVLT